MHNITSMFSRFLANLICSPHNEIKLEEVKININDRKRPPCGLQDIMFTTGQKTITI